MFKLSKLVFIVTLDTAPLSFEFKGVIEKISKACKKYIFLSVPRNEKVWLDFVVQLPIIGKREFRFVTLKNKVTTPAHFWEVDDGSVSTSDFEQTFCKCNLSIVTKMKRFSRIFYAFSIN